MQEDSSDLSGFLQLRSILKPERNRFCIDIFEYLSVGTVEKTRNVQNEKVQITKAYS